MRTVLLALSLLLPTVAFGGAIDAPAALTALKHNQAVLIDVRSDAEFAQGALPGALQITHEQIAERISAVVPDKDATIVLYCRSGRRSGLAQEQLHALGYKNVINAGGYTQLQSQLKP